MCIFINEYAISLLRANLLYVVDGYITQMALSTWQYLNISSEMRISLYPSFYVIHNTFSFNAVFKCPLSLYRYSIPFNDTYIFFYFKIQFGFSFVSPIWSNKKFIYVRIAYWKRNLLLQRYQFILFMYNVCLKWVSKIYIAGIKYISGTYELMKVYESHFLKIDIFTRQIFCFVRFKFKAHPFHRRVCSCLAGWLLLLMHIWPGPILEQNCRWQVTEGQDLASPHPHNVPVCVCVCAESISKENKYVFFKRKIPFPSSEVEENKQTHTQTREQAKWKCAQARCRRGSNVFK